MALMVYSTQIYSTHTHASLSIPYKFERNIQFTRRITTPEEMDSGRLGWDVLKDQDNLVPGEPFRPDVPEEYFLEYVKNVPKLAPHTALVFPDNGRCVGAWFDEYCRIRIDDDECWVIMTDMPIDQKYMRPAIKVEVMKEVR